MEEMAQRTTEGSNPDPRHVRDMRSSPRDKRQMIILRIIVGALCYLWAAYSTLVFVFAYLNNDLTNTPYWYFSALGAVLIGSVVLP